jgi:hypothetical protein
MLLGFRLQIPSYNLGQEVNMKAPVQNAKDYFNDIVH